MGKACEQRCSGDDCDLEVFEILLNMQLVCKDWEKAVCSTFSGCCALDAQQAGAAKLAEICKNLPSTSRLEIFIWDEDLEDYFDLNAISGCWGLSSLRLHYSTPEGGNENLNLAMLPSGLKDLETWGYHIDMASAEHLKCGGLTRLCLSSTFDTYPQILQLLLRLKELKVTALPKTDLLFAIR